MTKHELKVWLEQDPSPDDSQVALAGGANAYVAILDSDGFREIGSLRWPRDETIVPRRFGGR